MLRFKKRLITGLAAVSLMVSGVFAESLIDDLTGGNQNKWGGYWYFFTADYKLENGTYPLTPPQSTISNAGAPDDYGPMSFNPDGDGYGGSGQSARVVVGTLTTCSETDYAVGCDFAAVGIGTQLVTGADTLVGGGADFNNITGFTYWGKTNRSVTSWVQFKVNTVENGSEDDDAACNNAYYPTGTPPCVPGKPSESIRTRNAYGKFDSLTTAWRKITVSIANSTVAAADVGKQVCGNYSLPATDPLYPSQACNGGTTQSTSGETAVKAGDLVQAGYWGPRFSFKKDRMVAIQWQFAKDKNAGLAGGDAIMIDDIYTTGSYTFVAKDMCLSCVSEPAIPTSGVSLFSNFDEVVSTDGDANLRQNALNKYWYMYDDEEAGGGSTINDGPCMEYNEVTQKDDLAVSGNGNGNNGVCIDFALGSRFEQTVNGTTSNIQPFVGIGTELYDTTGGKGISGATYFNSETSEVQGFYFEYKTTGDITEISVEVEDKESVEAGNGEVYYVKVPSTGGVWKGATVKFSQLDLPTWAKRAGKSFGYDKIAKFQFKFQGATNSQGKLSIDNVYLLGGKNSVKLVGSKVQATTGLRAVYNRGKIGVNWNAASSVASGKIQLVNTKGRVVATAPIAKTAGMISANLGTNAIPTGMYFVRVNAKDINGKKIVQQVPLSVVK